jgi:hypothetical protein
MSTVKVVKLLDAPVQINLNSGLNPLGEFNPLTSYVTGDSVSYQGSSYVAIQATTGNLPTNNLFWQVIAEKGADGATGPQGPAGSSFTPTFETVSKNLDNLTPTFGYTSGVLTSITYTNGVITIVKTLNYTSGVLTSIVLSGDTPSGIDLTKTLNYTSGTLTSFTYS